MKNSDISKTAGEKFDPAESNTTTKGDPKSPADVAAEDAAAAAEKFPGFAESLDLLKKLNADLVSSFEEWQAKQPRIRALKAHIHRVQQGLPILPATTANEQIAGVLARRKGQSIRKTRIEKLNQFLARPTPKFSTPPAFDLSTEPKARLLQEPEVLKSLWKCRVLLAQWEIAEHENFHFAHPAERVHEVEHEIQNVENPADIQPLLDELNGLKNLVGKNLSESVAERCIEKSMRPALEEIGDLIGICRGLLLDWGEQARAAEAEFFKRFNLPVKVTAASLRFDAAVKALPNVGRSALEFFGFGEPTED